MSRNVGVPFQVPTKAPPGAGPATLFVGLEGAEFDLESRTFTQPAKFWSSGDGDVWDSHLVPAVYANAQVSLDLQYGNGMWGCILSYTIASNTIFVAAASALRDNDGNVTVPGAMFWSSDGISWFPGTLPTSITGLDQMDVNFLFYAQGMWLLVGTWLVTSGGDSFTAEWCCSSYDGKTWTLVVKANPSASPGPIATGPSFFNTNPIGGGPACPSGCWTVAYYNPPGVNNTGYEFFFPPNRNWPINGTTIPIMKGDYITSSSEGGVNNPLANPSFSGVPGITNEMLLSNALPGTFAAVRSDSSSDKMDYTTDTITAQIVGSGQYWPSADWLISEVFKNGAVIMYGLTGVSTGYVAFFSYTGAAWYSKQPFLPTNPLSLEWDGVNNEWLIHNLSTGETEQVTNPNAFNPVLLSANNLRAPNPGASKDQDVPSQYKLSNDLPGSWTAVRYSFNGNGSLELAVAGITQDVVSSGDGWPAAAPWLQTFQLTNTPGNLSSIFYGQAGGLP